jgi:hypothetical protein
MSVTVSGFSKESGTRARSNTMAFDVVLRQPGRAEDRSLLGAEDNERLAAGIQVLAAFARQRIHEGAQDLLGARARIMDHILSACDSDHRNGAVVPRVSAFDMKRFPRTLLFVLCNAQREFTGLAVSRLVECPRSTSTDIREDQAQRASYRCVAFPTLSEHVMSGVDVELFRNRPIDNDHGRHRIRGRLHRQKIELGSADRLDCSDYDREALCVASRHDGIHGNLFDRSGAHEGGMKPSSASGGRRADASVRSTLKIVGERSEARRSSAAHRNSR